MVLLALGAGCQSEDSGRVHPSADVVQIPGAGDDIDFDDIAYSPHLGRVLVPARDNGLYLVDPDSGKARRIDLPEPLRSADSAAAGHGSLFVADRDTTTLAVIDPTGGQLRTSVEVGATPDYVRYLPDSGELWVAEPSGDGIEVFAVPNRPTIPPQRTGFISVPDGPEGLTVATLAGQTRVFTHAGNDLVAIDTADHTLQRWPTGCDGTHGFPRVDARDHLVLASCANDGRVVLMSADTGEQLAHYDVGGGESLPAWSDRTGHFYVRSDPGTTLATLDPSETGLTVVAEVEVPAVGHCLGADDQGHYWTCDAAEGRLLRFGDPPS
ncbi:YncE family protein [Jiangella muralis]|uniref:YncE family protein n=1 Tax=Jiangella muralis TaxID=702383 RepID=UPI0012FC6894|nr:hypothetical protein [Jiangella muralis]